MKKFFPGDKEQRMQRMETNFKFLFSQMNKIHTALCPDEIGTWQERTEQAAKQATQSAKDLQNAMDIIGKQTYQLSVLKNGLERLRHDNDWQGVDEVNAFFDKLLLEVI